MPSRDMPQGDPVLMEIEHAFRRDLMLGHGVFQRGAASLAHVQKVHVFAAAEARDHAFFQVFYFPERNFHGTRLKQGLRRVKPFRNVRMGLPKDAWRVGFGLVACEKLS